MAQQPRVSARVKWNGGDAYLHGANVPWFNWGCDFGCGDGGGVSSAGVSSAVSAGFSQMADSGMNVARWWVFPGDPWQITRDGSGAPTGIDAAVYADFDAALALAEQHDIYYVFTIFSAPTDLPSAWLTNPTQRNQLADALGTLFARYSGHPRVFTWQIINEPEWDIRSNLVRLADVQALVEAVTASVHANSSAYASVGAASLDGLPLWMSLGLDYYTAHWYDYMADRGLCARCTDYAEVQARYSLDAPLIIGELYAGPDTDALQRFEYFYAKGYAGAWAWSLFPGRTSDSLAIDLAAAGAFFSNHSDIGP